MEGEPGKTYWEKKKEIFSRFLEDDPEDLPDFLAENCGRDDDLRRDVEAFIAAYREAGDFIERPAFNVTSAITGEPRIDRNLGRYRILEQIGSGGMGAVFLAERSDGEFSQQVAVKIIRHIFADRELVDRFKRERQILANLNHPNIAKLIDGGVSESGEPFLAMEFIEGEPIMSFAETRGLSVEERLKLFIKVCRAVKYAHQNLIIHRDLKPGNILVTNDGEPKLLDFGLAKFLDENTLTDAERTQTAYRAFTPAYASPEQIRGDQLTTFSDIYSLGVVLYELLTTKHPFDFGNKNVDQIGRMISELDPPLPSANSTQPGRITQLKGDLDNIALRAMRKEPERRYESVEAFIDDIERHLNGLPVKARPNTYGYRALKFAKRHKAGVIAALLVILSLVGGLAASVWQARIARQEKEKAENINSFLEQTLRYSNPILSDLHKNGSETTVNEVLDEAARRLDSGEFDGSPELKAELARTVAATYFGQGKYAQARKFMGQYVSFLKDNYRENDPKMIAGSILWANLLFSKGDIEEAESSYRHYLPLLRQEYADGDAKPAELAEALNNFAYLRRTQGDSREAESLFRETLELIPRLSDQDRNSVATTRSTLAPTLADQGEFDEAFENAEIAVSEFREQGRTDSPSYGFSLTIYGGFLIDRRRYNEADSALRESETILRKLLSPHALWLGDNLRNQAISFYFQGRYGDAVDKANETLEIYDEAFGKYYDNYPTVLIYKGLSLARSGRQADGERLLREALKMRSESLPADHFWVAEAKSALGECLMLRKDYQDAEPLLRESLESLEKSQGVGNPRTVLARQRLDLFNENRRDAKNRGMP